MDRYVGRSIVLEVEDIFVYIHGHIYIYRSRDTHNQIDKDTDM